METTQLEPISTIDIDRELSLLEHIEHNPDITQATLASQLGVAVGTVNWHLKRLVAKGYVKVKRAQRRKLRYIITPEGIALRARLTVNYIETSLDLYRRTRRHVRELLVQVKQEGHETVQITGEGDIADICRLTCLEQGIRVAERPIHSGAATSIQSQDLPNLEVRGAKVFLKMQPPIDADIGKRTVLSTTPSND
jgi:DNA-binding MarR family transcriptional regulator